VAALTVAAVELPPPPFSVPSKNPKASLSIHVSFHYQRLLRCSRRLAGKTTPAAAAAAGLRRHTSPVASRPQLRPKPSHGELLFPSAPFPGQGAAGSAGFRRTALSPPPKGHIAPPPLFLSRVFRVNGGHGCESAESSRDPGVKWKLQ
jgi:hypothetical protein